MIDVLPYNGDESTDNPRNNAFDPSSSTASKYHDGSPKKSAVLAAIPVTPSGTTLEYVVYSPNNPASYPQNIKQDPCAVSNLPAGFDPLTDPDGAGPLTAAEMFTVTTSHHAFLRYHLRFVAIPFALEWLEAAGRHRYQ